MKKRTKKLREWWVVAVGGMAIEAVQDEAVARESAKDWTFAKVVHVREVPSEC